MSTHNSDAAETLLPSVMAQALTDGNRPQREGMELLFTSPLCIAQMNRALEIVDELQHLTCE